MEHRLPPRTIHQIFAQNLRSQCMRFESIAAVCRASGINRQQFNRYLSGQNLPNPRTLKKLSEVLQIPETQLFDSGNEQENARAAKLKHIAAGFSKAGFADFEHILNRLADKPQPSQLIPGYYFCYAPLNDHPELAVRSLIKVYAAGGQVRFSRRTMFSSPIRQERQTPIGKHVGLIIADLHASLLIGYNAMYPHEFSVMKILRTIGQVSPLASGMALLRVPDKEMACNICIQWLGDGGASTGKAALKQLGIVALDDASVPPAVAKLLSAPHTAIFANFDLAANYLTPPAN
ncbi:MAG: helix-turn-helix transcriptional regulator [Alphaproteobacteria bacterium]|nr:helix-turn-helix transcriptional regulator [Alphaproteobacteria bacterium]